VRDRSYRLAAQAPYNPRALPLPKRASRTPYGCIVSTIDGMIVSDELQRSQMTVYIAKHKTQSPPKYHTSANCPKGAVVPHAHVNATAGGTALALASMKEEWRRWPEPR
jgi:hypothetical protein